MMYLDKINRSWFKKSFSFCFHFQSRTDTKFNPNYVNTAAPKSKNPQANI